MHGDGIKLGTTTDNPPSRVLDLTRLFSRAGRVLTGVDRVEHAYLAHLLQDSAPAFGLVRSSFGYLLLDRVGLEAALDRFNGYAAWGRRDVLSRSARGKDPFAQRAESDARRWAVARCLPSRLGRMLAKHVPQNSQYLNVGHSNLTQRTLWALRHDLSAQIVVLVHDAIPLDYPEYQRPGTPDVFRHKLKRIQQFADLVIYNSADTQTQVEKHMRVWGNLPKAVVAPLGVHLAVPDANALPPELDLSKPYFVTVGTIEPRKNHALLLDAWEVMSNDLSPDQVPILYICGGRGWNNDAVFQRLDALRADDPIKEVSGLTDGAMAALVQGARGLLFPSLAEGYGLPPIEAAAVGTPVVCLDLPVYRETLGDIPVYLNATDRYLLANTVQSLSKRPKDEQTSPSGFVPPTWEDHFRLALTPL